MIHNLIVKRNNHIKEYLEFNKIEEPPFDISHIVTWSSIISEINSSKGKNFKVLELGTKRSKNDSPTHKKSLFKHITNLEYVMTDYQEGLDVDVVCDIHKTEGVFEDESFDLILSFSTFEHFKYPQLCSHNLMKMLKNGGRIVIQTHQTFPLHGYKYDYFRFSREALKSIFSKKMNFRTITSYFSYPCAIVPHIDYGVWNDVAESYLNVFYIGEKTNKTPSEYIYDIDNDN
jgi:SAM-dependent methyltransferase